jgi:hypothetical protein
MTIIVALAVAAVAGGIALIFAASPGGDGTLLTTIARAALFLAAVYATANAAACWAAGY